MSETPTAWQIKRIEEFAEVITGGTPSTTNKDYWENGDIPWLPSGDLKDCKIEKAHKFITKAGLANSAAKLMPINTVLIALTGATTGQTGLLKFEASANQSVTGILPSKDHIPEYLFYFLRSIRKHILKKSYGGAQKHISQDFVKNIDVPLPPLQTQKKIVTALEKAERLIQLRNEADKLADEYLKAVFYEMFGDPVKNPKGWKIVPMREIVENILAGISVEGERRPKTKEEFGVLKISAVTSGKFLPHEHKAVKTRPSDKKFISPSKWDVLISRANTRELVAATCIVEDDYPDLFLSDKLWKIQLNRKLVDPFYYASVLRSKTYRFEITKKATGTSGSMLNISQSDLLDTNFPLAPIEIQNKYAKIAKQLELLRSHQNHSKRHIEDLFGSTVQSAFKGDLIC